MSANNGTGEPEAAPERSVPLVKAQIIPAVAGVRIDNEPSLGGDVLVLSFGAPESIVEVVLEPGFAEAEVLAPAMAAIRANAAKIKPATEAERRQIERAQDATEAIRRRQGS